jgi:hypothetical protein
MNESKSVTLKTLIDLKLLSPGSELSWKRRSVGSSFTAIVNSDGSIETTDGIIHKTPSGAARHLNSGKPIDGWNVWRVATTKETLADLRNKIIRTDS